MDFADVNRAEGRAAIGVAESARGHREQPVGAIRPEAQGNAILCRSKLGVIGKTERPSR